MDEERKEWLRERRDVNRETNDNDDEKKAE
jgi:hypothetical protein